MGFRDENTALRERLNALESELEDLRGLPGQLARVQAERDSLARKLDKRDRSTKSKRQPKRRRKSGAPWSIASFIIAVFTALPAIGSMQAEEGFHGPIPVETTNAVRLFEWCVNIGFLAMGASLLLISLALFAANRWGRRALDVWAISAAIFVLGSAVWEASFTGEVPVGGLVLFLIYPAIVGFAWSSRKLSAAR